MISSPWIQGHLQRGGSVSNRQELYEMELWETIERKTSVCLAVIKRRRKSEVHIDGTIIN
jgi:hypothetical protein